MPLNLAISSNFFEPSRTYTDGTAYRAPEDIRIFEVVLVTRHPDRGHLRAVGWMKTAVVGSGWHMQAVDESEYQQGAWHLDANSTTLLGHPAADDATSVLLVCTYGWSCPCTAPAVIIYAEGPTPDSTRQAADDTAWAHAGGLASALEVGEHVPGSEHHRCTDPELTMLSALRIVPFAAPQVQLYSDQPTSTILRVRARALDGARA
ncbi:hypothetical protein [Streptomyces sp. NPDC054865]